MATLGSLATRAEAAPCCAGGGASASLITGEERASFSATLSQAAVIGDAPVNGRAVFRAAQDSEVTRTLTLDGALLLSDRWQAGASLPVAWRSVSRGGAFSSLGPGASEGTGLGDARVGVAYEFLPDLTYSRWRPKGFAYAQLVIPSGRSIHEISGAGGPVSLGDVTGEGFWAAVIGAQLVKRWTVWDAAFSLEARPSFARDFERDRAVAPGTQLTASIGAGASAGNARVGVRLAPLYRFSGTADGSPVSDRLSWNSELSATWLLNDLESIAAVYTDQTLMGPAWNATLSRTFAITYQARWDR